MKHLKNSTAVLLCLFLSAKVALATPPPIDIDAFLRGEAQKQLPFLHTRVGPINVFTASLEGMPIKSGTTEILFSAPPPEFSNPNPDIEQFEPLPKLVGNHFSLWKTHFRTGESLLFPILLSESEGRLGHYRLDFSEHFMSTLGVPARMMAKSGRFVVLFHDQSPEIHDTVANVTYTLESFQSDHGETWRPTKANFANGREAFFTWAHFYTPEAPAPLKIELKTESGVNVQRVLFEWENFPELNAPRLKHVTTSFPFRPDYDPNDSQHRWLRTEYSYDTDDPGKLLSVAQLGEPKHGYKLTWAAHDSSCLESIKNWQGKLLFQFDDCDYESFREGSTDSEPTRITYETDADTQWPLVSVRYPHKPDETLLLHGALGNVVSQKVGGCSVPRKELEYVYDETSSLDGMLKKLTLRPNCDSSEKLIREYDYNEQGKLTNVLLKYIDETGAVRTSNSNILQDVRAAANGTRRSVITEQAVDGQTTRLEWASFNPKLLTALTLPSGESSEVNYSIASGTQTQLVAKVVQHPSGRKDKLEFDSRGRPKKLTLGTGAVDQNMTAVSSLSYDTVGRVDQTVDSNGNETRFFFQEDGLLKRTLTTSPGLASLEIKTEYDSGFPIIPVLQTRIFNEGGSDSISRWKRSTIHPERPLLTKVESGGDGVSTLTEVERSYNPSTFLLERECSLKGSGDEGCVTHSYHSDGRLDYSESLSGTFRKTVLYDEHNLVRGQRITDELGSYELTFERDEAGRITKETLSGGGESIERTLEYNEDGLLTLEKVERNGVALSEVHTSYDNETELVQRISDLVSGSSTDFEYNADANGGFSWLPSKVINSINGVPVSIQETHQYDLYERPVAFTNWTQGVGSYTGYIYRNADGEVLERTDAQGNIESFVYDALGRLTRKESPFYRFNYDYSLSGQEQEVTEQKTVMNGSGAFESHFSPVSTRYSYDAFGRITEIREDLNTDLIHEYFYDHPRGFLTQVMSKRGDSGAPLASKEFAYDSEGRLTEGFVSGQRLFTHSYSGRGKLISEVGPLGETTRHFYNPLGEPVRSVLPDASPDDAVDQRVKEVLSREFLDPRQSGGVAKRVTERDEEGTLIARSFNSFGEVLGVEYSEGPYPASEKVFSRSQTGLLESLELFNAGELSSTIDYSYDADGRVALETNTLFHGDGTQTTYTLGKSYNSLGYLTDLIYPDEFASHVQYIRNNFGQIERVLLNGEELVSYSFYGPHIDKITLGDVSRDLDYHSDYHSLQRVRDTLPGMEAVDMRYYYDDLKRLVRREDHAVRGTNEEFSYDPDTGMLMSFDIREWPFGAVEELQYGPSPGGVLDLQGAVDHEYKLTERYQYGNYGRPLSDLGGDGLFLWSRGGLTEMYRNNVTAIFKRDAFGRIVEIERSSDGSVSSKLRVSDDGMSLYSLKSEQ